MRLPGPRLKLKIKCATGLKEGDEGFDQGDKWSSAFVVADFTELEDDGYKKRELDALHRCKTAKKIVKLNAELLQECRWEQTLITCRLPVNRMRLRLTVWKWNADKRGKNEDFWGMVKLDLSDIELPYTGEAKLQPLMDKSKNVLTSVTGRFTFSLSKKRETCIRRIMNVARPMVVEVDPHAQMVKSMKKKVRCRVRVE